MIRKIILTSLCLVVLPVFYCIIKFLNAKECLIVYSDHIYNYETMSYDHLKYIISYYGDTELKTDHITDDQKKQCEFLDLKNKYIHSGLTDAHTHLLTTDFSKSKSWMQTIEYSSSLSDIQRINLGLKNAKSMLLYGFTTVRDVGNSGNFLDVQLRNHIRKNHLRAPNLIVTGPGITYLEPQFNIKNENGEYIVINMSTQIENIFKTYIDNNITWIKVYSDNSIKNNIMPKELLNRLVETAHRLNLKVVLHTEFFDSFRNSITTGADTVEHFYEFDSTGASSRKPVLTITPLSFEDCEALNKNSFSLASNCILAEHLKTKQINLANGNGFDIIFGSDFVNDNITGHLNRGEATTATLISLSKNNLSPQQIFKIAVLNPNKIFNSYNFQTNLVAYDEDPMADIKNIHKPYLVIKEGLIVSNDD